MDKPKIDAASRIAWIDIAKGIAILMVVLGHAFRDEMRVINPVYDTIYRCIYIFHMSFFFWMSGYVYGMRREKAVKNVSFITKKAKKQLIPWALYSVGIYVIFFAASLIGPVREILVRTGYGLVSPLEYIVQSVQAINPYAYHLWFVYLLFLIASLVWLVDRLSKGSDIGLLALGVFSLAVLAVSSSPMPFLGDWYLLVFRFFLYTPFYLLGILMQRWKVKEQTQKWWEIAGVAYILIRVFCFSGFIGNSVETPYYLLTLMVRYAGYALLPGAMLLLCRVSVKIAGSRGGEALEKLGSSSFLIYLFHQPFCCAFVGIVLYRELHVPAIVTVAVCCALSTAVPFVLHAVADPVMAKLRAKRERITT